jgi:hypothetical protein
MKATCTTIPKISIHPNKINIYNELHWSPAKPVKDRSQLNLKYYVDDEGNLIENHEKRTAQIINSSRKANGRVSNHARKKMLKASDYLLMMAGNKSIQSQFSGRTFKFKIAFITLTLPSSQVHDDKEIINKCLNQFIIEIKKYYKVRNYIWRAEKQKNGNIHFHILIDKYIAWQQLRDRWNRIINKLGYVNQYREEQKTWHKNGFRPRPELYKTWPLTKQRKAYERGSKQHWNSPNTTDIHSVQKIHNIKQYISKYMSKSEAPYQIKGTNVKISIYQTGRLWGCNRELSNITGAKAEIDSKLESELQLLIDADNVHKYQGDYFTVVYIDFKELELNNLDGLFKLFSSYMFEQFGFPVQTNLHPD